MENGAFAPENIMENGAFALLEQYYIFHIFKSIQNSTLIFLEFFSMLSKNR